MLRIIKTLCAKKKFEGMAKYSYNRIRSSYALIFRSKLTVCIMAIVIFAGGKESFARNLLHNERIRGEVELTANVQSNKQTGSNGGRKSDIVVFEQRLRLRTKGNVYHDKLLSYEAAVGVGLVQQDVDSTGFKQKTSGTIHEYNFSAQILKAKPYPIALHTAKTQNLIARQFRGTLKMQNESSNVDFSIRSNKWPMTFSYSTKTSLQDSFGSTSDNASSDYSKTIEDRFRYDVNHDFNPHSRLSFNFERIEVTSFRTDSKVSRKRDRYQTMHFLDFGEAGQKNLASSLFFTQTSGNIPTDELRITEGLRLQHSKNFRTNHKFRFTENKNSLSKNTETNWESGFVHSLFKSLTTAGNIRLSESKIGDISENERQQGNFSLNYRKVNPFGVASVSYNTAISQSKQTGDSGVAAVIGEVHIATADLVLLERRNIDIDTIRVEDGNGDLYNRYSDYDITETNGRVYLEIIPFGAPDPSFTDPNGSQQFFVDYEYFVEPSREEETLSQRFYVRQEFKNGLALFYEYSSSEQDISSNVTAVTPDESQSHAYGFDFSKGNFNVFGELRDLDSTQIVSRSTRLRARYRWNLNAVTNASIHVLRETYRYTFPSKTKSSVFRFGGELATQLNGKTSVSAAVNYLENISSGGYKTTGLEFRSALRYKYRQLLFNTGVDINILETSASKSESLFFYCRLKRFF